MSTFVNFTFEPTAGTFQCPTEAQLDSNYLPGDGQIFLDTSSLFFLTPPSGGGGAPLASLIAVGALGGLPNVPVLGPNYKNNALYSGVTVGVTNAPVTGFMNATPESPNQYMLAFMAQDAAGVIIPPSNVCQMGPVQTSAIEAFLPPGTNNCFIANATFRSSDSPPVMMLRQFRDHVLLKHSSGRGFVEWYYSWSPDAAN